MSMLLWQIIRLLKVEQFKCRGLTEGELQICKMVFADLIDYSRVKIMNQPYLPWQTAGILMAPNGCIYMKDTDYCEDFSLHSRWIQSIFIHEMAHIYQHQRQVNVLLKGAFLQTAMFASFKKYNPYHYTFEANKPYFDYNIEQQGDIARDIFLKRIPNIILSPELITKN